MGRDLKDTSSSVCFADSFPDGGKPGDEAEFRFRTVYNKLFAVCLPLIRRRSATPSPQGEGYIRDCSLQSASQTASPTGGSRVAEAEF